MVTSVTGDLNQVKNGFTYEIDFDAMTEINTKFRATLRPIKREPCKQTRNFMWEIQAGQQGEWIKFDQVENQQVRFDFGFLFPVRSSIFEITGHTAAQQKIFVFRFSFFVFRFSFFVFRFSFSHKCC
jgi:hypothetical protein